MNTINTSTNLVSTHHSPQHNTTPDTNPNNTSHHDPDAPPLVQQEDVSQKHTLQDGTPSSQEPSCTTNHDNDNTQEDHDVSLEDLHRQIEQSLDFRTMGSYNEEERRQQFDAPAINTQDAIRKHVAEAYAELDRRRRVYQQYANHPMIHPPANPTIATTSSTAAKTTAITTKNAVKDDGTMTRNEEDDQTEMPSPQEVRLREMQSIISNKLWKQHVSHDNISSTASSIASSSTQSCTITNPRASRQQQHNELAPPSSQDDRLSYMDPSMKQHHHDAPSMITSSATTTADPREEALQARAAYMTFYNPDQAYILVQIASRRIPPYSDTPGIRFVRAAPNKQVSMIQKQDLMRKDPMQQRVTTYSIPAHEPLIIPNCPEHLLNNNYIITKSKILNDRYLQRYQVQLKEAEESYAKRQMGIVDDTWKPPQQQSKRRKRQPMRPVHLIHASSQQTTTHQEKSATDSSPPIPHGQTDSSHGPDSMQCTTAGRLDDVTAAAAGTLQGDCLDCESVAEIKSAPSRESTHHATPSDTTTAASSSDTKGKPTGDHVQSPHGTAADTATRNNHPHRRHAATAAAPPTTSTSNHPKHHRSPHASRGRTARSGRCTATSRVPHGTSSSRHTPKPIYGTFDIDRSLEQRDLQYAAIIFIQDDLARKGETPEHAIIFLQAFGTDEDCDAYIKYVAGPVLPQYHIDCVRMYEFGFLDSFDENRVRLFYRNKEQQITMTRPIIESNKVKSFYQFKEEQMRHAATTTAASTTNTATTTTTSTTATNLAADPNMTNFAPTNPHVAATPDTTKVAPPMNKKNNTAKCPILSSHLAGGTGICNSTSTHNDTSKAADERSSSNNGIYRDESSHAPASFYSQIPSSTASMLDMDRLDPQRRQQLQRSIRTKSLLDHISEQQ